MPPAVMKPCSSPMVRIGVRPSALRSAGFACGPRIATRQPGTSSGLVMRRTTTGFPPPDETTTGVGDGTTTFEPPDDSTTDDGGMTGDCPNVDTCQGASGIGLVSGDSGSDTVGASGSESTWIEFQVTENDDSLVGAQLSFTATLQSPAGADFDLYVYRSGAGGASGATVMAVDLPDQALAALEANAIDLVLINRKLDIDMSDGLEILKSIRSSSSKRDVPVMLVSNYADWQEKAVQMGAIYGFGKAELNRPETRARLAAVLEDSK